MSDLISRSALLEALEKEEKIYKDNQTYPSFYTAKAVTRHQPSVEPPNGEWIHSGLLFEADMCSVCNCSIYNTHGMNFCPHCGARMKGE